MAAGMPRLGGHQRFILAAAITISSKNFRRRKGDGVKHASRPSWRRPQWLSREESDGIWLTNSQDFWYSGKVTRRRVIGYGVTAGALGATMLVPAPWRAAFGQAKPYKIGTLQPLSGAARAGGKTALVGVQMAVDRINKSGGINGRPVELVVADDESKPDVGRRKAEKLVVEDKVDAHVGGFLSNICLACMPVFEEAKIVNMISVCLDTTLTTTKCNRYSFRPFDYAPAQAVAFAPYLVNKMGKKWHIAYADYSWGQSTRDAYAQRDQEGGRRGRRHHRHSARHRRHDAVPVQDHRQLRRPVRHLLRQGRRDHRQPGLRSRPDQEVQMGRRRRDRRIDQPAGARQQDRGLRRHQPLRPGSRCAAQHAVAQEVLRRSRQSALQGRSIRPARCPTATCSRTTRR